MSQTTTNLDALKAEAKRCTQARESQHAEAVYYLGEVRKCLDGTYGGGPPIDMYLSAGGYTEKLAAVLKDTADASRAERDAWTAYHRAERAERDAAPRRPTPCAICGHDYSAGHCACTLSEPLDGEGPQGEDYMEALACRNRMLSCGG